MSNTEQFQLAHSEIKYHNNKMPTSYLIISGLNGWAGSPERQQLVILQLHVR